MPGPTHTPPPDRVGGSFRYEVRLTRGRGATIIFNITVGSDEEAVERCRYLLGRHDFEIGEVWYAMELVARVTPGE